MQRPRRQRTDLGMPKDSSEPPAKRLRGETTPVKSRGRRQRPNGQNGANYDSGRQQRNRDSAAKSYGQQKSKGVQELCFW